VNSQDTKVIVSTEISTAQFHNPTAEQLNALCKKIAEALGKSTGTSYVLSACSMGEISINDGTNPAKKRQAITSASTTPATYIAQATYDDPNASLPLVPWQIALIVVGVIVVVGAAVGVYFVFRKSAARNSQDTTTSNPYRLN